MLGVLTTTPGPPGWVAAAATRPHGSGRGGPPATGNATATGTRECWPDDVDTRSSSADSHPVTVVDAPHQVRRRVVPPSTGAVKTSDTFSRVEVHATCVPSGDSRGEVTGAWSADTRQARPPASGATQTSSSATKETTSPDTCGQRRYDSSVTSSTVPTRAGRVAPFG